MVRMRQALRGSWRSCWQICVACYCKKCLNRQRGVTAAYLSGMVWVGYAIAGDGLGVDTQGRFLRRKTFDDASACFYQRRFGS